MTASTLVIKVNVSAFGCAKNDCVHFRISSDFINEDSSKPTFVPDCKVLLNFLFVFVMCFFLRVLRIFKLFPVLALPQENFWMEVSRNQPGWLFTLCISADRFCCLLAG